MSMGLGGQSRRPARGGKIKGPKRVGLDVSIDQMWARLAKAIGHIQNHDISKLSYEEHYRYAYNLVLYQQGDMLYSGVRRLIEEHLVKLCVEKIVPAFPPGGPSSVPPGIIIPVMLRQQQEKVRQQQKAARVSHASVAMSASMKGKGKSSSLYPHADLVIGQEANDSAVSSEDDAAGSVGVSTTQGAGDRADMVARSQAGERFLKAVSEVWQDHCACMSKLREVLKYVDRVYVAQAEVRPIWDLGLELFRDTLLRSTRFAIDHRLYTTLLTQIQIEREGSVINRSAVKSNIDMLNSLTPPKHWDGTAKSMMYKIEFEPAFLATSEEFYKVESEKMLDGGDAIRYLRHVERRFEEEDTRVAVYLSSQTNAPLRSLLERCLLSKHLQTIVDMPGSGLVTMLDDDRVEDVERLYRLFRRADGLQVLKLSLKAYVNAKGKVINSAVDTTSKATATGAAAPPKDEAASVSANAQQASTPQAATAIKWVEDVLAFKARFDRLLPISLHDDKGCEVSINEAFETFVNSNPRAPEFISLFIDENLKKGLKGKTEEEVDQVLDQTITVFRFLHEKDVFERYYKGHLAKRMLQGRSVSDDAERGMMAKLKVECGHGYVQKLQGMLNDMKVSEETLAAFNESIRKSGRPMPFDLGVNVLTSTYWPISAQAQTCTMPAIMMDARQAFERYYQSRHSGRLLTWHPNHGNADVRVAFKTRKHELNVSTYALVVLLVFEDVDESTSISFQELQSTTGISTADLQRTLQSLACAKYKILLKEPKGREVGTSDKFSFNHGFQCNLARIKIAQVAARVETASERKETTEKVEEERKNQVEACIVRVMKDRKTMTHNDLVNEVIRQLSSRFGPSPILVKRRIESLIDREYLERTENMNVYNYQA